MRKHTKAIDLFKAQKAMFDKLSNDRKAGHTLLAEEGVKDSLAITRGATPSGLDRKKALAKNPQFARRASGRRRAAAGGSWPLLPIGNVTFKLARAIKKRPVPTTKTQSYGVWPWGIDYAKYILSAGGTNKMVARGYQQEMYKRWRPKNAAFIKSYQAKQKS